MRLLQLALAGLSSLLLLTASAAGQPAGEVAYSRAADAVVVEFRETLGELRGPGFSLRIYGDGRFAVERPLGMRRAGAFAGRLEPAALGQLMRGLADEGVLGFDSAAVKSARRAARAGSVFQVSDPSVLELVVRAARTPPGAAAAATPAEQRIRWVGLRGDARAHPEIEALQGLARSCAALRALVDAPDLEPAP